MNNSFVEKIPCLVVESQVQFDESTKREQTIQANLKEFGCGG